MNDGSAPGPGWPECVWPGAGNAAYDSALLPPARRGLDSAWYGHVPFAHWLVTATSPRLMVELGTWDGVSLSAFCEAALRADIPTACLAVPVTHADATLAEFHDARYGAFFRLVGADEALAAVADGSVDLLHVAGPDVVSAAWWPKLSDRAVVLLTHAQGPAIEHPAFDFTHAGGLSVLAVGRHVSAPVAELCSMDAAGGARTQAWFATLGARWELDAQRHQQAAGAAREQALERDLLRRRVELDRAHAVRLRAERDLQIATARASGFRYERDLLLNSTFWRLTYPLRLLVGQAPRLSAVLILQRLRAQLLARPWARGPAAVLRRLRPPTPAARPGIAQGLTVPGAADRQQRVVFVSGEPRTAGHLYRVLRPAAAAVEAGAAVAVMDTGDCAGRLDELAGADLLIVWRAEWNADLARLYAAARRNGVRIAYDLDDLMLRPDLARVEVIDGIRSQDFAEQTMVTMFTNIARALREADVGIATTEEIAYAMRSLQKPAFVLPNGFDDAAVAAARLAVRARAAEGDTGVVRIGYAGGSRTHQRDFAVAAAAVARLLAARPQCRLVLFRTAAEQIPLLDIEEYDGLLRCLDQIEWRDTVPAELLGGEIARFDINLAPLEVGNPFCEAKSELKFFEAAVSGVCTIASPTGPFARAIRDGKTGLLAETEDEWFAALCRLVDDPILRWGLAQAAYHAVLHPFGQQRRAEMAWSLLCQLGGGRPAGRAFALDVKPALPAALPDLPATETLFSADRLGVAEVTVVIPVYNYQAHVEEALDSVAGQSLAALDLVVVDDCSTDRSLAVVLAWAERHAHRFNRLLVLHNATNAGLGPTRNAGFAAAETPYVLPLDADNRLRPECCGTTLETLRTSGAAFAYPRIQCFGLSHDVIGGQPFLAMRLVGGNYIDAMALVGKWAWAAVGGYRSQRLGWEDYEFWCRLAERGLWGAPAEAVLADYRVHGESMLHRTTEQPRHKHALVGEMQRLHPWLSITLPGAAADEEPREAA